MGREGREGRAWPQWAGALLNSGQWRWWAFEMALFMVAFGAGRLSGVGMMLMKPSSSPAVGFAQQAASDAVPPPPVHGVLPDSSAPPGFVPASTWPEGWPSMVPADPSPRPAPLRRGCVATDDVNRTLLAALAARTGHTLPLDLLAIGASNHSRNRACEPALARRARLSRPNRSSFVTLAHITCLLRR
jgi:hypothetical protein